MKPSSELESWLGSFDSNEVIKFSASTSNGILFKSITLTTCDENKGKTSNCKSYSVQNINSEFFIKKQIQGSYDLVFPGNQNHTQSWQLYLEIKIIFFLISQKKSFNSKIFDFQIFIYDVKVILDYISYKPGNRNQMISWFWYYQMTA